MFIFGTWKPSRSGMEFLLALRHLSRDALMELRRSGIMSGLARRLTSMRVISYLKIMWAGVPEQKFWVQPTPVSRSISRLLKPILRFGRCV